MNSLFGNSNETFITKEEKANGNLLNFNTLNSQLHVLFVLEIEFSLYNFFSPIFSISSANCYVIS